MKAEITHLGVLKIIPENGTEAYALNQWFVAEVTGRLPTDPSQHKNYVPVSSLNIDMSEYPSNFGKQD